jgi:DNA-binding transcriptional regulator of glucitol operon
MLYAFLIFGLLWLAQFALAYLQMRRFARRLAALRALGRCAVGLHGDRWCGRTYAIVAADSAGAIRAVEILSGWTVFACPQPLATLNGTNLGALAALDAPPPGITARQWGAIRHAASFLQPVAAAPGGVPARA